MNDNIIAGVSLIILLAIAFFLTGCATMGNPYGPNTGEPVVAVVDANTYDDVVIYANPDVGTRQRLGKVRNAEGFVEEITGIRSPTSVSFLVEDTGEGEYTVGPVTLAPGDAVMLIVGQRPVETMLLVETGGASNHESDGPIA